MWVTCSDKNLIRRLGKTWQKQPELSEDLEVHQGKPGTPSSKKLKGLDIKIEDESTWGTILDRSQGKRRVSRAMPT